MGPLLEFTRIPKYHWSPMDYEKVNAAVTRALAEAQEFHALANQLPLRIRNKILRRQQATQVDDIYLPWGGLFPHPRVKREGF